MREEENDIEIARCRTYFDYLLWVTGESFRDKTFEDAIGSHGRRLLRRQITVNSPVWPTIPGLTHHTWSWYRSLTLSGCVGLHHWPLGHYQRSLNVIDREMTIAKLLPEVRTQSKSPWSRVLAGYRCTRLATRSSFEDSRVLGSSSITC